MNKDNLTTNKNKFLLILSLGAFGLSGCNLSEGNSKKPVYDNYNPISNTSITKPDRQDLLAQVANAQSALDHQGYKLRESFSWVTNKDRYKRGQPSQVKQVRVELASIDDSLLTPDVTLSTKRVALANYVKSVKNLRTHYSTDSSDELDVTINLKANLLTQQLNSIYSGLLAQKSTSIPFLGENTLKEAGAPWNLEFIDFVRSSSEFNIENFVSQLDQLRTLIVDINTEASKLDLSKRNHPTVFIMWNSLPPKEPLVDTNTFVSHCLNANEQYFKNNLKDVSDNLASVGIRFTGADSTTLDEPYFRNWARENAFDSNQKLKTVPEIFNKYRDTVREYTRNESLRDTIDQNKLLELKSQYILRREAIESLLK